LGSNINPKRAKKTLRKQSSFIVGECFGAFTIIHQYSALLCNLSCGLQQEHVCLFYTVNAKIFAYGGEEKGFSLA
jgi:hypothetical protein